MSWSQLLCTMNSGSSHSVQNISPCRNAIWQAATVVSVIGESSAVLAQMHDRTLQIRVL